MNLPALLTSTVFVVLFKWTCLLTLGWLAHWTLRHRHARWRLILWRSILCCGLILPLLQFFEVPGIKIPITIENTSIGELTSPLQSIATSKTAQTTIPVVQTPATPVISSTISTGKNSVYPQTSPKPISWNNIIMVIWALGCAYGSIRLIHLHLQLSRLRRKASLPISELEQLAAQIQRKFNIHRTIEVKISESVTSPFVCGLFKPAIILPQILAQQSTPGEMTALLNHEFAHLRQNDLLWCVAWRWVKAILWFHPFVWQIPAAHNLACEQEADRLASRQLADPAAYASMLARLALRMLALPAIETKLTVNGSSCLTRRLNHLAQKGSDAWNWKYSVAGFALAGLLFLATAGCKLSASGSADTNASTTIEFKKVLVVVQDEDGKPIEGATVLPDGFRVKGIHGADAYGWNKKLFSSPEKAITDHDGKAYVKYPVEGIPEEKEFTDKLIFSVSHPEFTTARPQDYSVDSPEQPIRLTRGIRLEVLSYFGPEHQPVSNLTPNLSEENIRADDWQKMENGSLVFQRLSPGGHLIQLMGQLPSGEVVYSDTIAFTAEKGTPSHLILEMKPGIRLEGRLDDSVPRPVKNGRVMIDVRPPQYPTLNVLEDFYGIDEKYGGYTARQFWHSYRPINEDGTFTFESIPSGTVDVVVLGDGFASKTIEQLQKRVNGVFKKGPAMAIPQAFPLGAPVTKIRVVTEPTATLEFTATTKSSKPIKGVWVGMYPSVFRMWGMFGWMENSSEDLYRKIPHLPDPAFSGETDQNGRLVISNLPAEIRGLDVDSQQFQVPLQDAKGWRDRHVRTMFSPGITNQLAITLEPKGTDYIGTAR